MTPPSVLEGVRGALGLDPSDPIRIRPVGGGCINHGAQVVSRTGSFFLKWNGSAAPDFFAVEADGLDALAAARTVRTPAILARSQPHEPTPWLLLEWIDQGRASEASWRRLGRELAALHRRGTDELRWGWHRDNYIGALPQPNGHTGDWPDFWARGRILPLTRQLLTRGTISARQADLIERAADRAGDLLGPASLADGPSLLHGDLWSGNVLFALGRHPVLIDPAVYIGHREVDLAMCRLFGGFPRAFHDSYAEVWPLQPDHRRRLALYQLYPLLVHARLFGGGYVGSTVRAAEAVAGT